VPVYGSGEYCEDVYSARSDLCPWMWIGTHLDHPEWSVFAGELSDHRAVADYFYGDYFPLTPYSKSEEAWMAWEFVRPDRAMGWSRPSAVKTAPMMSSTSSLGASRATRATR